MAPPTTLTASLPGSLPGSLTALGDRPDFADYVSDRRAALVRVARGITGDLTAAEDLVQSTLEHVYLSWDRIRDYRAADAYVRRAMVNQHHSWWRRGWRRTETSVPEIPDASRVVDIAPELEADDRALLWSLVQALPPRQRAAVVLRYYEELSEAETARVLGCSVGTVKSNTSRGLATLRRRALDLLGGDRRLVADDVA